MTIPAKNICVIPFYNVRRKSQEKQDSTWAAPYKKFRLKGSALERSEPFRRRFAAGKATVLGVFSRRTINGTCQEPTSWDRARFRRTVSRRLRNEGITDGFWRGAIPGTKAHAREIAADRRGGRVYEGLGSDQCCCRSIRTNLPSYRDPHLQKFSSLTGPDRVSFVSE